MRQQKTKNGKAKIQASLKIRIFLKNPKNAKEYMYID